MVLNMPVLTSRCPQQTMAPTAKRQKVDTKPKPKHLILNAFDMLCPSLQTVGLWQHPDDKSRDYNTIGYWTHLAQVLERGKFNALFIADVLSGYDVYQGPRNNRAVAKAGAQFPVDDPHAVIPVMAAVTKNLSFAVTSSTISEAPYHFARRLATLDHLTKGRVGWNVVSSYLDSSARNLLNGSPLTDHDERYDKAQEFLEIVYQLFLSSWADDAVELKNGVFSNPDKIREINYEGKYYTVPGPSITEPTPQRLPVILQAGASKRGTEYAAKNAEAVFITLNTAEELKTKIDNLKKEVKKQGRNPDDVKTVIQITVITAPTYDEAVAKLNDYKSYVDREGVQGLFSGWTGIDISKYGYDEVIGNVQTNASKSAVDKWANNDSEDPAKKKNTRAAIIEDILIGGAGPVVVGDPNEVADELIRWHEVSGVDGFNFTYAITPGTFEDLVDYVVPVLQERGYAQKEYPKEGLTFRENLYGVGETFLKPDHPAYGLRWKAGETKEEFEERLPGVLEANFSK
ncbi:Dimethyl-sulfide monooxygenase [Candida viswanathii]|uniref:Dimethyl-sulfide monooxygenase n=1 Tax=Candida viswanathii TaxID=5486 RepID=A0A367XV81_9ASCO|nr:Dimethyl-sulfide monooxygenase [Candida viswanathii]